ncbi:GntR family transcriptional regulator [Polaribacter glomeratus]|uniref:Transcriptional regulator n=1 Tax=Polaribacter glomeratus TaxID=102 RepID=A0A2S7WYX1_9FLAO|nr:GntR family transcriptional regulator [Polaribacter glomeratus]PQJ82769.1 transcriptional regulator [Polaribacter glomeratus]TXD65313.1 GntR family transcriptional regulator [Polaribacter glomeratus]
MEIVSLQKDSGTPKYKQIVTSIENAIINGLLKKGDKLPSLNTIKNQHSLSRDTVLVAFNELKNRGIIHSIVGKGYYVSTENVVVEQKIFLLFDELNSFKEDLYNSFLNNLGDNIQVDIFFHHFNSNIFAKLINDNIGNYSSYVIMPANLVGTEKIIQNLPKEKVYILDQVHKGLEEYPAVYQNFEKDIFNGLYAALTHISNYQKIVLLFSDEKQPKGILQGFQLFCNQHNLVSEVVSSIKDRVPEIGELYLVLDDQNLIRIIKKIKENKLVLGKNIGIISFNDSLLKEVVENGITTISTDFNLMGKKLAQMVLNNEQIKIENPSSLILRKSI